MSVLGNLARRASNLVTQPGPPVPLGSRFAVSPYGSITGRYTGSDPEQQMLQYRRNSTLHAGIKLNMSMFAGVRWHLYRKSANPAQGAVGDTREEVFNHAALDMWNQPNAWMPGRYFRAASRQHVELTGKSCWVISFVGNIPGSMWPVRPDRIYPVPDVKQFIAGWVYTGPNGEQVPLENREVIWIREPDPEDPYGNVGAVEPLMSDLQTADLTSAWKRNFFLNDASPGGFVQFPVALSDTEFKKLVARWRDQHQGVSKAHRIAFLEMGATFQAVDMSLADMQLVEQRQDNRDAILEGIQTSKVMLGAVDDVNRANSDGAEYIGSKGRLKPALEDLRDVANYQFLPKFGGPGKGVEFDFDNPVPDDKVADAQVDLSRSRGLQALVSVGYEPDDAAERMGFKGLKHTGVIPGTLTPAKDMPDETYESAATEKGAA